MQGKIVIGLSAALGWAFALIACGAAAPPPTPPPAEPPPAVIGSPTTESPPMGSAAPGASAEPRGGCKLPAPKKSGDPCKADADCGPSALCHAPACVAKAKSPSRPMNVMCTMSYGCDTADANRCGCYEGSCALIPPP